MVATPRRNPQLERSASLNVFSCKSLIPFKYSGRFDVVKLDLDENSF